MYSLFYSVGKLFYLCTIQESGSMETWGSSGFPWIQNTDNQHLFICQTTWMYRNVQHLCIWKRNKSIGSIASWTHWSPYCDNKTSLSVRESSANHVTVLMAFLSFFSGSCFIRTDQLDGETDWKLKVAVGCTQRLPAVGVWINYDQVNLW